LSHSIFDCCRHYHQKSAADNKNVLGVVLISSDEKTAKQAAVHKQPCCTATVLVSQGHTCLE
jgi:hypothetical protein